MQVLYLGRAPVQRRLCPIFVRNVGSPDIHECFRGLTGSQRTPGFGESLHELPRTTFFHLYHNIMISISVIVA